MLIRARVCGLSVEADLGLITLLCEGLLDLDLLALDLARPRGLDLDRDVGILDLTVLS